jgi:hypothetical protein
VKKNMSEKQNIELPTIKSGTGFSFSPDYTLTFKNTEVLESWTEKVHAIPFAQNHYLVEGHICLCQIEQPVAEKPKEAPRVSASVGKAQSFTMDYSTGRITRPY